MFWPWLLSAALAGGLLLQYLSGRRRDAEADRALRAAGAENQQLRKQIQAEQFNLEAIIKSMAEGLLVVDQKHVVRLVNASFTEFFRLKRNPVGLTVIEAIRDAGVEDLVKEVLQTNQPANREVSVVHPGKKPLHLGVSAVPAKEADVVVLVFHNITQLREVEEMRREFVANVSHELRTPLSIFQGYLETLIDIPEMEEEQRLEILSVMNRHSKRLNAIVEDLLTLARLEARSVLEPEFIEIEPLLQRTVQDWKRQAVERQIALEWKAEAGLPPVWADAFRLDQVFNNLLENALKYTPTGGRVTIEASSTDGDILFSVQDTGVGIPPADLPHIFERFYRVEKGRSRDAGGTGLGLSIVKHIALLHGGSVEATSAYGNGTRISIRLPKAQA